MTTEQTVPTWDEIVEQHSARVYRLAYRLTGNPHDAEDLTQEVFVRVFRSLGTYTPALSRAGCTGSPRTCSSTAPGARPRSGSTLSPRMPISGSQAVCHPRTPTSPTAISRTTSRPRSRISPDFRAAVVLCDVEGLSYEEIADVLGLKLGTVRSRIHRGRTMLRKALAHRAPQPGRVRYSGPAEVAIST